MFAVLFALVSYFGWGVGDIFAVVATRKIGSFSQSFWRFVLVLLIFSLYIPFVLDDLSKYTLGLLVLNLLIGVLAVAGTVAFYEGTRITNPSLVGTVASAFVVVTVVLSLVFLGETITASQFAAISIIFLGIALSILNLKDLMSRKFSVERGVLLGVFTMLAWGTYFTFIKIPIREVGWFWSNYITYTSIILLFLYMRARKIKLERPNFKGAFPPLLGAALLLGTAEFSYNFAISQGQVAIVAPIAGSYPTLFVLLAFLVFKDPITRQQIFGIMTTLTGIVLLSFFSI